MGTSVSDIRRWLETGKTRGNKWMFVITDTYDYEDYPVYVNTDEEFWKERAYYNEKNMQRITESYNLQADLEEQLAMTRCYATP